MTNEGNEEMRKAERLARVMSRRQLMGRGAGIMAGAVLAGSGTLPGAWGRAVVAQDGAMIDRLNLGSMGGGTNPQINFNPYSPTGLSGGWMYETLYISNDYDCSEVPWLATAYEWRDPQTLVFTIRDGITWSDGTAFSAADVAFTFNLLKKVPAFDTGGVGPALTSITAEGAAVTFAFTEAGSPLFNKIIDALIVAKHVWEPQADPVTFLNETPVGTGPFLFKSFNPQELVFERNPNYWQAELIKIQEIAYTKAGEGQVDQLRLSRGEYDWNAMYVPNIEQIFVAKDPENNHYWFPQGGLISLSFNLTKEPFNDVKFREAMAYAVNRDEIAEKAQLGYVTTASQTGLKLPGQQDMLSPNVQNNGNIPFDKAKADQLLAAAGYTKNGDGQLLNKSGQAISFSFQTPSGWNDWTTAAQIVQRNMADVGVTMDVQTPSVEIHDEQRAAGNFDAMFTVHGGTCSMYQNYHDHLGSDVTAPVGETAKSNWVRWQDPKTDELLGQLKNATDPNAQMAAVHGLQDIHVTQYPTIPLWYGAIWFQYRTEKAIGWPNAEDPYASPNDGLLILTRLQPAG